MKDKNNEIGKSVNENSFKLRIKNLTKKIKIPDWIILIVGLLILTYPLFANFYNTHIDKKIINQYEEKYKNMTDGEIEAFNKKAKEYNKSVDSYLDVKDPYSKNYEPEALAFVDLTFKDEPLGHLVIPTLDTDLPIYNGTSDKILSQGVGYLAGTSFPIGGESTHTVLTAHRGLPERVLFRNLDEMKKEDIFIIHMGREILYYKVSKTEIIEPTEVEKLDVIKGKDQVTLLTCHPYMINSHRLIVTGERTDYTPELKDRVDEIIRDNFWKNFWNKYAEYIISAIIILIVIIFTIYQEKKKISKFKSEKEIFQGEEDNIKKE